MAQREFWQTAYCYVAKCGGPLRDFIAQEINNHWLAGELFDH